MNNKPIKIIAIGGPTASGKTEASLELAHEFNGAIISCDSRQIYREMDISTDKIPYTLPYQDPILHKDIEHYGINLTTIDRPWSLYDWQKYAHQAIEKIDGDSKIPFLVGGTGLYIQSIVENYELREDHDPKLREQLNNMSLSELHVRLKELDKNVFNQIDNQNPRRLIRAIEKVNYELRITNYDCSENVSSTFNVDGIVLSFIPDRDKIREKVTKRVDIHIENGVLEEVKKLIKKYGPEDPILNSTISVQEYIPYIQGEITLEEAKQKVIINNYHYAKRQMTWFRKYGNTVFCDDTDDMKNEIKQFLTE